jgi:hypothetical protein
MSEVVEERFCSRSWSAVKRWFSYWRENIQESSERYDKIGGFVAAACFIVGLILTLLWPEKDRTELINTRTIGVSLQALGVLCGLWCLLWLPFRRHEKMKGEYETQTAALEAKLRDAEFRANDSTERNAKAEAEKFVKDACRQALGNWLLNFESRKREVRQLSHYSYDQDAHKLELEKSGILVRDAYAFLATHLGTDAAALFHTARGPNTASPKRWDNISEMEYRRQMHLDSLEGYIAELKQIVQRYIS